MEQSRGFPPGTRYIPVPSQILGPLLEEIHSVAELQCTLRLLGLVHLRRGRRLWVTMAEFLADPVLLKALAHEPQGPREAIRGGVMQAVKRGTLLIREDAEGGEAQTLLFVNDAPGRQALENLGPKEVQFSVQELSQEEASAGTPPTIFSLYEENIGLLTPLLAEELKEAEESYPWPWIQQAFREAVVRNHRSWRYIARTLERWAAEGKDYGESGRHTQATDRKEYLRRYGRLAR